MPPQPEKEQQQVQVDPEAPATHRDATEQEQLSPEKIKTEVKPDQKEAEIEAEKPKEAAKPENEMAKLQKELNSGGPCGKNCPWISVSLLAGACMGTGAFLFASNFSDQGQNATGLIGPAPCIILIFLRLTCELKYKRKNGSWYKPKNSRIKENGKWVWTTIIPLLGNVLTNAGYLISMSLGWKFAKAAGLNQGVISTLLSCASVFNMIIFYFKFGEKISKLHFIGVMLMIACILCISMEAAGGDKDGEEEFNPDDVFGLSQQAAGILAICCGLLSAILMSTKHVFIRLYKKNYSGVDQGIDSSIIEFALYSLFLIPLSGTSDFTIGLKEMAIGSVAGILICSGRIFISIGVSIGLAAPAQSLMSTHSLHQAVWSAAVAGQTLSVLQILGLGFGLFGVFSISYFDHLASKMKMKNQLKKMKSQESVEMKQTQPKDDEKQVESLPQPESNRVN